jgi:low temperature requirement protein LtrA
MAEGVFGPPRLRIGGPDEERHATWLETFFDLVFVVAVSQVADRLAIRLTIPSVLEFLALFVPIVWAWIGTVFYTDRFGTDSLGDRLAVLVQMAAAAVLAVSAGGALRFTSASFALAYAAIRLGMVVQYAFAWLYVPEARPITRRYVRGFLLAAVLWALSALFAPPWRFILWGVGVAVDFAVPLSAGQLHARFAPHTRHLPERFGLFTLIVLGETIVSVVAGLAGHPWSWLDALTGFLGLVLAFSFWWLYFDSLDDAVIRAARERGRIWVYQSWLYAHLPLWAALAATGVGIAYAIRADQYHALPAPQRWLVAGGAAVCFGSLGIIHYAKALAGTTRCSLPRARVRWGGAAASLLIALFGWLLYPIGVLGLLAAVGAAEIGWEMWAGGAGTAAAGE